MLNFDKYLLFLYLLALTNHMVVSPSFVLFIGINFIEQLLFHHLDFDTICMCFH